MKRIVAVILSAILLITCATAFAEDTVAYRELDLASQAISAMSTTVESLTMNMRIMAELLAQKQAYEFALDDTELKNLTKQMAELYNKLNAMTFDAYADDILQDISKEIANQKPPMITEDGNEAENDIYEDDLNAFLEALIGSMTDENGNLIPPEAKSDPIVGGWTINDDYTITDAMGNMVATATADIPDVNITPIACIGTQLVAGENFCYFCHVKRQAEPDDNGVEYILLYIYVDLNGNAEVIGWTYISPGGMAHHIE